MAWSGHSIDSRRVRRRTLGLLLVASVTTQLTFVPVGSKAKFRALPHASLLGLVFGGSARADTITDFLADQAQMTVERPPPELPWAEAWKSWGTGEGIVKAPGQNLGDDVKQNVVIAFFALLLVVPAAVFRMMENDVRSQAIRPSAPLVEEVVELEQRDERRGKSRAKVRRSRR
eukprot:TRINITY_DN83879_c0_g1_i1.p1 TRINITY_DN83879_c0_g1~~TRINITY_DN83879_c0_g1_i1.p1  ORF type:complete len:174 (+),score=30.02 TRINITY_DN83879_c0_g1_i1:156-677(+)